ncbi:MAG: cation-translocating P-type ATPase [Bacillota bacterium]|nr:cation-translocating P-type ATPase [Bacillota bacterium]
MLRFNLFIRKYTEPFMWISGICIILAMFLKVSILYVISFILVGIPIVFKAIQALRFNTIGIELLVSIAAIGACLIGEYSEAAIVTFLFQFGSFLEQKTMKKTRSAIKALTEMAPTTAWKILGDTVEEIEADEIEEGDILLVKAGNQIACDGIVLSGEGYAKESSITGESLPKHKTMGDLVFSGTLLDSGLIHMEATKVGEDTTFSKIISLVEEAQDAKSPVERFIDRFAKYYTPSVIVLAALVLIFTKNVDTAITVLVLACPGALVIGAPIANVAGIGKGAQEGILLKGGDSIHTYCKTDTFVFDKTGTLTQGNPSVVRQKEYTKEVDHVLRLAASLEKMSDHPLAQAIVKYVGNVEYITFDKIIQEKGKGISAIKEDLNICVGNLRFMQENEVLVEESVQKDIVSFQEKGMSIVLVAINNTVSLLLGISDPIKPETKECIAKLKKLGVSKVMMLTGDNAISATLVCEQLNIDAFEAELLPQDKLHIIQKLQKEGRTVTFVGDGINDSPALVASDIGIAMGNGMDVAIDSSDVVLIKSDFKSLVKSLQLARRTVRILYQNIAIAIITVFLLLAGLFAGYIHMSIGMLIHEASILVVILNAMRLLIKEKEK